jgi:hypothetical protein
MPFRNLVNENIALSRSQRTLLFVQGLFDLMKIGGLVSLHDVELCYADHLDWYVLGEVGCAASAMFRIIDECFPGESLRLMGWFGGKMARCRKAENSSEVYHRNIASTPFVAVVSVHENGNLQEIFNKCFTNVGMPVIKNLLINGEVTAGVFYERISELPRVMMVQIARKCPTNDVIAWDLKRFYSSLSYEMMLDVRNSMLDPNSLDCTEFKLASFTARKTNWSMADGHSGYVSKSHYVTVCSSLERDSNELKWSLFAEGKIQKLNTDGEVMSFNGEAKALSQSNCVKEPNECCGRENEYFVDCFCFVRADCAGQYYQNDL